MQCMATDIHGGGYCTGRLRAPWHRSHTARLFIHLQPPLELNRTATALQRRGHRAAAIHDGAELCDVVCRKVLWRVAMPRDHSPKCVISLGRLAGAQ